MPQPSITKIHLKITYSKIHLNLPGANELIKIQKKSFTKNVYENIVCKVAAILSRGDELICDQS